jgi:predicted transcriptional regulator
VGKGVANARRIEILRLLAKQTDLSLTEIANQCRSDVRTIGDHVRRLVMAGLVMKRRRRVIVEHAPDPARQEGACFSQST